MNSHPTNLSHPIARRDLYRALALCVAMTTSGCLELPSLPELADSALDSGKPDHGVAQDLGPTLDGSDSNVIATFQLSHSLQTPVIGLPIYLPLPTGEVGEHDPSSLVVLADGVVVPAEVDNTTQGTGLWALVDFDGQMEITVLPGEPSAESVWSGFTAVHHFEELVELRFQSAVGDFPVSPVDVVVAEEGPFGNGITLPATEEVHFEMPRIGAEPDTAITRSGSRRTRPAGFARSSTSATAARAGVLTSSAVSCAQRLGTKILRPAALHVQLPPSPTRR